MARTNMVTSSRRAGRVTNKTKLLIYRGSDKVDLGSAEVIVWDSQNGDGTSSSEDTKHQHVGAKGVESGELLVSCFLAI
jgi:enhancer of polycomb-like protein